MTKSWIKRGIATAALSAALVAVPVAANAAHLVYTGTGGPGGYVYQNVDTGTKITSSIWRGSDWHTRTCER